MVVAGAGGDPALDAHDRRPRTPPARRHADADRVRGSKQAAERRRCPAGAGRASMEQFFTATPRGHRPSWSAQRARRPDRSCMMLLGAAAVRFGVACRPRAGSPRCEYPAARSVAAAWCGRSRCPAVLLAGGIAWIAARPCARVRAGFGILLPERGNPDRSCMTALRWCWTRSGRSIWYLIVLILGASVPSGANRKSVA